MSLNTYVIKIRMLIKYVDYIRTYVHSYMYIVVLTLSVKLTIAPAFSKHFVTSASPFFAATSKGVSPSYDKVRKFKD